jgi:hypothetical protein
MSPIQPPITAKIGHRVHPLLQIDCSGPVLVQKCAFEENSASCARISLLVHPKNFSFVFRFVCLTPVPAR